MLFLHIGLHLQRPDFEQVFATGGCEAAVSQQGNPPTMSTMPIKVWRFIRRTLSTQRPHGELKKWHLLCQPGVLPLRMSMTAAALRRAVQTFDVYLRFAHGSLPFVLETSVPAGRHDRWNAPLLPSQVLHLKPVDPEDSVKPDPFPLTRPLKLHFHSGPRKLSIRLCTSIQLLGLRQ